MQIKPVRIVYGADLAAVMAQHIAIPIFIGADLAARFSALHRAAGITAPLFHLHTDADGKLLARLWLIGNETMWARIDRRIDEYALPLPLPRLSVCLR